MFLCAFVTGLICGSFINVLVYRVVRGISIIFPFSFCPLCKRRIRWYSNIPLLSYLFQKGRCIECGQRISPRYPAVEFVTAMMFTAVYLKYGFSLFALKYFIFVFFMITAAFTDLDSALDSSFDCGYIPDHFTIGAVLAGYICAAFIPGDISFYDSLAGSGAGVFSLLIISYLYKFVRNIDALGEADAFLMGAAGSFLGPESIPYIITISALFGCIIGIFVVKINHNKNSVFPFAPMIAAGSFIYIFTASQLRSAMVF